MRRLLEFDNCEATADAPPEAGHWSQRFSPEDFEEVHGPGLLEAGSDAQAVDKQLKPKGVTRRYALPILATRGPALSLKLQSISACARTGKTEQQTVLCG